MTDLYLKALGPNRFAVHGGSGQWAEPGVWMPAVTPAMCERGYHVVDTTYALLDGLWLAEDLWLAEVRGQVLGPSEGKFCAEQARLVERLPWDAKMARLFACDCAERVLPIYETMYAGDYRPRRAIETARAFAVGAATQAEMAAARDASWWDDAAGDAAWDAARAAAGDAAWAAARAAGVTPGAAGDAGDAAGAAGAAAWAAGDAAGDAAWGDERRWQANHLDELLGINTWETP